MKMLEVLQKRESFLVLSAEKMKIVAPSSASFTGIGFIRDVVP